MPPTSHSRSNRSQSQCSRGARLCAYVGQSSRFARGLGDPPVAYRDTLCVDTIIAMDLKQFVRDVPDFPIPGILFRDITPLLAEPTALKYALDEMIARVEAKRPDAIAAIESRGFLFGAPIAARLGLPFVPIRKPGKLPAARMSMEYTLEYSQGQLDIHADALQPDQRAVIVDDLLATGGTAKAACKLIEMLGAQVAGLQFLIELEDLDGRALLKGHIVDAVISYT